MLKILGVQKDRSPQAGLFYMHWILPKLFAHSGIFFDVY